MRPENKKMKEFLKQNGIDAMPKYLPNGSLKGCWRLYNLKVKWFDNYNLQNKLTSLGFSDFDGDVLDNYDGSGGLFSVFLRGNKDINRAMLEGLYPIPNEGWANDQTTDNWQTVTALP